LKNRIKRQIHTPLRTYGWPDHLPGLTHALQYKWRGSTSLLDPSFPFREMMSSCKCFTHKSKMPFFTYNHVCPTLLVSLDYLSILDFSLWLSLCVYILSKSMLIQGQIRGERDISPCIKMYQYYIKNVPILYILVHVWELYMEICPYWYIFENYTWR
jgi:hypothetical protein